MNVNVEKQLQQIIERRSIASQDFKKQFDAWNLKSAHLAELKIRIEKLRREIALLHNDEQRSAAAAEFDTGAFDHVLAEYELKVQAGLDILQKAAKRFNRVEINIATAGESKCGKSTALKSILGLDMDDNSIIRNGDGTAMTASKHILCNIPDSEKDETVVDWHTEESFIQNVIYPMLIALLGEGRNVSERCKSISDFEYMNIDSLQRAVEKSAENNNILDQLRKIQEALPTFKSRLKGGSTTVPISETSHYTSHPQMGDSYEDVSYAVKECRSYFHFPNNEVFSIRVTDLPGLGTCDITEQQCFLHGFDLSVDLALLVRRPVANNQNFPNQNDLCVIKELENCMGYDLLPYSVVFFQNDANIHDGNAEIAYQSMMNVLEKDRQPLEVIRGDAKNRYYMQKELMPRLLEFMAENLPKADEILWQKFRKELKALEEAIQEIEDIICNALRRVRKAMPNYNKGDSIHDASKEMRRKFSVALDKYRGIYEEFPEGAREGNSEIKKCNDEIKSKIDSLAKELSQEFAKNLDQNSEEALERTREELSIWNHSPYVCAGEMIQNARVQLSEKYSELEHVYNHILDKVRDGIYQCFLNVAGESIPKDGNLVALKSTLEQYGNCTAMAEAIGHLLEVKMPFYSLIYPELRENVFDNMKLLQEQFTNVETPSQILRIMREITHNWTQNSRDALCRQVQIFKMISAQLERFQDQMTRNPGIENEWRHFVEHNPCLYMNEENLRLDEVRRQIDELEAFITGE